MNQPLGRILTTHSGSLPRPAEFLPLVLAQEAGEADDAEFAAGVRAAVQETVQREARRRRRRAQRRRDEQAQLRHLRQGPADRVRRRGVDPGGRGRGDGPRGFPRLRRADGPDDGPGRRSASPPATGRCRYVGQDAVQADIDNLKAAMEGVRPAGTFMSAASPGVIAVFSPNRYYSSQEEYLQALAEAMREEYEAIHQAGFVLQLDCPDLAMTAPGAGSLENFRRQMELQRRGAQPRAGQHPRRGLAHPHLLGQRRDAPDHRRRAQGHHRHHPEGQARRA